MSQTIDVHNLYSLTNGNYLYIDTLADQSGYSVYYFDSDKMLIDGGELDEYEEDGEFIPTENNVIDRCLEMVRRPGEDVDHRDASLKRSSIGTEDLEEMGFKGM